MSPKQDVKQLAEADGKEAAAAARQLRAAALAKQVGKPEGGGREGGGAGATAQSGDAKAKDKDKAAILATRWTRLFGGVEAGTEDNEDSVDTGFLRRRSRRAAFLSPRTPCEGLRGIESRRADSAQTGAVSLDASPQGQNVGTTEGINASLPVGDPLVGHGARRLKLTMTQELLFKGFSGGGVPNLTRRRPPMFLGVGRRSRQRHASKQSLGARTD